MSRYVEYDSLVADSYESDMWDRGTQRFNLRVVEVDDIENAPSLDIVRCAECIHFTKLSDGWGRCNTHGRTAQTIDFCCWGERKESE